jgi:hypothetical protein
MKYKQGNIENLRKEGNLFKNFGIALIYPKI